MTVKIGANIYASSYIDGRTGAALLAGDQLAHLGPDQCDVVAQVLQADLDPGQRRQLARLLNDATQPKQVTGAVTP